MRIFKLNQNEKCHDLNFRNFVESTEQDSDKILENRINQQWEIATWIDQFDINF